MARELVGLLLVVLLYPAVPLSGQEPSRPDPAPTLNPNDAVRIVVWRKPELTGEFRVGTDGTLQHPVYQDVRVVGVPLPEVRQRLRTVLERFETAPEFVVEPLFGVFTGGEVRQPNLYLLPAATTVSQAVAQAGGPLPSGRLDRVVVLRDGTRRVLNLTGDRQDLRERVQSGDQIMVSRRRNIFRDIIAPVASLAAASASIYAAVTR